MYQIHEEGPLVASIAVNKRISSQSWIRQVVSLSAFSRRIEFDTEVEWQESHQFLVSGKAGLGRAWKPKPSPTTTNFVSLCLDYVKIESRIQLGYRQ
jgi:hypothetical protein